MTHKFMQVLNNEVWFIAVLNCDMWYAKLLNFQCVICGVMHWLKKKQEIRDMHMYDMEIYYDWWHTCLL